MAKEVHLWRVGPEGTLNEVQRDSLNLEERLQNWLAQDIAVLDPGLLVIGREVETDFGGFIDLLCMDSVGDLVVVELEEVAGCEPRVSVAPLPELCSVYCCRVPCQLLDPPKDLFDVNVLLSLN